MLLSVAIAKAGLSDGIIRNYKEYDATQEMRDLFSSTIIVRGVILALITTFIYIAIIPAIMNYLKIDKQYVNCFLIMAAYLLIRPLNIIVTNILRIRGRTLFLNVSGIFVRILSIIISLFLLMYAIRELYGYFIGVVVGEFMSAVILFYWFFNNYKVGLNKVSGDLTIKLIKFGLPLLLTELSFLVLTYVDRYMILSYRGESALGLYSAGYTVAMYISDMITFALSYAIVPIYVGIYSNDGRTKTEEFLNKSLHYILIVLIPLCVGYYAVSEDLFITLASRKYLSAASFSPIILVASLLLGLNNILNAGLYLQKKSRTILIIMVSALSIKIVLNILFLPYYGAMGAAISTLISCMAASGLTAYFSFKHIKITIYFNNLFFYLLLSAGMYLVIRQIETSMSWVNLTMKIIIGVSMFIAGLVFKEKEIMGKVRMIYHPNKN
jgi:O-antigen/teichoic acid export membrane protein